MYFNNLKPKEVKITIRSANKLGRLQFHLHHFLHSASEEALIKIIILNKVYNFICNRS